jgi:hypothetical protein
MKMAETTKAMLANVKKFGLPLLEANDACFKTAP